MYGDWFLAKTYSVARWRYFAYFIRVTRPARQNVTQIKLTNFLPPELVADKHTSATIKPRNSGLIGGGDGLPRLSLFKRWYFMCLLNVTSSLKWNISQLNCVTSAEGNVNRLMHLVCILVYVSPLCCVFIDQLSSTLVSIDYKYDFVTCVYVVRRVSWPRCSPAV